MVRHGCPQLLLLVTLSGCAGFWHPRLTENPLPPGESLIEAAVRVVLARQPRDSTRTVIVIGPGPTDSVTLVAPAVPTAASNILRFSDERLAPDSLAMTLTYATSCGGPCSCGGSTVVLHRKPGRNWTFWAVTSSWVEDITVMQRAR